MKIFEDETVSEHVGRVTNLMLMSMKDRIHFVTTNTIKRDGFVLLILAGIYEEFDYQCITFTHERKDTISLH